MASRVNIRFVVILSASLVMVFALSVGVFLYVKGKSADRYIRLGDEAMAKGEIDNADEFYSIAVNKDKTNVLYLTKWRSARERKVPASETEYGGEYRMYAHGILYSLARLQRHDLGAQREYLQELLNAQRRFGGGREGWEAMIEQVNETLAAQPEQPPAIRRYRGLAVAGLMQHVADPGRELLETAQADLTAALAADSADFEAAEQLNFIYSTLAMRARAAGNTQEFRSWLDKSAALTRSVVEAHPRDPSAMLLGLLAEAGAVEFKVAGEPEATRMRAQLEALDALRPRVGEIAAAIVAAKPEALRTALVLRFVNLAPMLDRTDGLRHAQAVLDRALLAFPDNAELMFYSARITSQRGELDAALATLDRLLALPRRPVSLDGLALMEIQRRAHFEQANIAVAKAAIGTAEERAAGLEIARQRRARLASAVAERSPELLLVDAKIMVASGDPRSAQAALTEFLRAPGDIAYQVPDARVMLGAIAAGLNPPQLGLARDSYRLALDDRPGAVTVMLALAAVELALENRSAAAELYRAVLQIEPENQTALAGLPIAQGRTDDPVLKVLLEAEALSKGTGAKLGDNRAALALVEGALERHGPEPRLVLTAVQLRLMLGEREAAERTLAAGLQEHPADERLKAMRQRLQVTGSMEGALAVIEESAAAPVEKWLDRRRVYEAYGKTAEAAAATAEAARIAPDDPRVVEYQFVDAFMKNDLPALAQIAERAIRLNADRADGDTYRARQQIAQGNLREAVTLLERAAKRGNATPGLLRLLGDACLQLGRGPDAVEAFRRAADLDPTDPFSLRLHVAALAQTGRRQEALAAARASETFGRRDPVFLNLWLSLEADAGNTNFARERREELLAANPDNADNAAALADLLIRERNWDRARAIIDALRAKRDSLQAASLDARWHSGRGDPARGAQLLRDFAAALPEAQRAGGYMHLAAFLMDAGRLDEGLAAMRQAAEFQDRATMPVDLEIARTLLNRGRPAEAEAAYRKVLDAGVPDPRLAIRKLLVETLLLQGRAADAEAMIAQLGAAAEEDVELLVKRARALSDLARTRDARELLDRAIARFPGEPLPYFQRARLAMADPVLVEDAIADLTAAIKLNPAYWQALRTRALLAWAQSRHDDALRDWDAAVKSVPAFDELRWELVDRLLDRNRERDAVAAVEAGAAPRAGDARYFVAAAQRFGNASRWERAAEYYKRVLAIMPGPEAAALCLDAMLSASPPLLADAERILATPGLEVEKSIRLLLSRAAVRKHQARDGLMRSDLLAAFDLIKGPAEYVGWFEGMRRVVGSPAAAVALLDSLRPTGPLVEWFALSRPITFLDDPARRAESLTQLAALAKSAQDPLVRHNAAKAASQAFANDDKWEDSVAAARSGLEAFPDDAMLGNNAAFILSEELNRPAEALPLAEKALGAAPQSIEIIDTAACVYWRLGQREKAVQTASTALSLPRVDADKSKLMMKLARWKLELGDRPGAASLLNQLREMAAESPAALPPALTDTFAKLQQDIEAAR